MKIFNQPIRRWLVIGVSLVFVSVALLPGFSKASETSTPGYVVLGDSIEVGVGATNPAFDGYVPQFHLYLLSSGTPVELHNLSESGATTKEIAIEQLAPAVAAIEHHQPYGVVVSWGGGGDDLLQFITSPQAATCRQQPSCLGRLNGLLNNIEQRVDRTIRKLRDAAGPESLILMRTQYNPLLRSGCPVTPEQVALATGALEGFPGTILEERGLNDRLREIAAKHDAQVVELFVPFFPPLGDPDELISEDCAHPTDAGHELISGLFIAAYEAWAAN